MKTWKSLSLCLLLAALWATGSLAAPSAVARKICSFQACTGTGACLCPNGQQGHCVNGACTL